MAKYCGKIGYVEQAVTAYQTTGEIVTEHLAYGEVDKNRDRVVSGSNVNSDVVINNVISIVADQYAWEHYFAIRYAWWMGKRWKVESVEVRRPRLILTLGGLYNGNTNGSR